MTFSRVRLDHKGIGQVMRSAPVRAAVSAASEQVASAARASGRPVEVRIEPAVPGPGIRDGRPVGRVSVTSPGAAGREVTDGLLANAAAAVGLEVSG